MHYIGYESCFDEWKEKEDLVDLSEASEGDTEAASCQVHRFSLYHELSIRIKASLNSSRKESPIVCVDIPFDKVEFDGGLRLCGKVKRTVRGIEHHNISKYQDLNSFLGVDWHFRGINENGDFCYAILDTVEFYLYRRRPIKEFKPGTPPVHVYKNTGYVIVFSFVKGNGVPSQFGTDIQIFVN